MSTAIARNFQVGNDPTPANNFTLYQPSTPDGTVRLGNGNTGTTSSLLTLTSAGNLGIGTSSPAYNLHVASTSNATIFSQNTTSGVTAFIGTSGTGLGQFGSTNSGIRFLSNNAETVRIDTSGNVGIGTVSSGARLDVVSSSLPFRIASSTSSGYALAQFGQSATASQNWHIGSEGDGTFRWYNGNFGAGTYVAGITSAGNFQFNSGYGSVATAFGCRAWVNFNGTGTVAIRASGNVSSITDNGTGQYTVNFTTAMPDANYAFQGAAAANFGVDPAALFASGTNAGWVAAGSFRFFTFANAGGATDYSIISVSIFR